MGKATVARGRNLAAVTARWTVDYRRISEDQNGEGAGVERQGEDNALLAKAKGRKIDKSYVDNDISALDESKVRPEFERLVADVEAGRISMIIVWHMDRLCVRMDDWARLLKAGRKHEVTIAAVHGISIDLSDPTGVAVAQILISIAEMERRHKGNRQRRANRQRAEKGLPNAAGGLRPFGYDKDRLTVREDEAAAIRAAAQTVVDGGSVYGIAKAWNEAGTPRSVMAEACAQGRHAVKHCTKPDHDKCRHDCTPDQHQWTPGAVSAVLRNPRYAGLVEYHGEIVNDKAEWSAILDRATWERVQGKLSNGGHSTGKREKHLLTGLVFCECGQAMTYGGQQGAYRCNRTLRASGWQGCGRVSRKREILEQHVVDEWAKHMFKVTNSLHFTPELSAAVDGSAARADKLNAERAEIIRQVDTLRTRWTTGKLRDDDFWPMLDTLRNRQDEIEDELERVDNPIEVDPTSDVLSTMAKLMREGHMLTWEQALDRIDGTVAKREFLSRNIERIDVSKHAKKGSNRFDPSTVKIAFRDAA